MGRPNRQHRARHGKSDPADARAAAAAVLAGEALGVPKACGDNPARLASEAALAKLCGVSPVDASSGRQIRHRLNRGGNRQANRALHTVVVVRLRMHAPTRAYMARRLAEGKTKKEVMRCLKRFVVREVFTTIRDRSTVPLVISSAA